MRASTAEDERLATKAPTYAFRLDDTPYAVAHDAYRERLGPYPEAAGLRHVWLSRLGETSE